MRSWIHNRLLMAALACLIAAASLPLPLGQSVAQAAGLLLQDTFESGTSGAWTVDSGQWQIEEGDSPILFAENFESGSADKWTRNGGTWSAVTDNGSIAYRQSAGGASELVAGDTAWSDYVLEADVRLISGAGAMLNFRYQDSQRFYYLYMSEHYIRLMKQKPDGQDWITAYDGPSLGANANVRIKVEATGNTYRIYRNDELVISVSDDNSPYLTGKIALASWDSSVQYDNIEVVETGANHVYAQTDADGGIAHAGQASWNHYAMQSYMKLQSIDSEGAVGIMVRRQSSGDGYWLRYDAGTQSVQLVKRSGATDEVLDQAPFNMMPNRGYQWSAVAAGSKLSLQIDGVKLLEATDSSYASGAVALVTEGAIAAYDNVTVERVTVPVESEGNTTYYVSASGGDDDNDGLSPEAPWQSLSKVNNGVFRAGDSILLQAGDQWDEPLVLRGSGEPGKPITVGAYGDGVKPIIRWNAPNGGSVVTGHNLSHWVIDGLSVHIVASAGQSWSNITVGIQLLYDNAKLYEDVQIINNDVYSDTYDSNTNGIMISASVPGTDGKEVARDLTIAGNTVHDVAWYGITTTGWDIERNEELRSQLLYGNVQVIGNEVYRTASQGIVIQNAHDSAIERNVVREGGLGNDTWGPGGLWFIASRDSVIRFNEVYGMKDASSGYDGAGINVDWYCDNILVQYNYAHGNKGNGMTTMSNNGAKIIQNRVEGNQALQSNGRGQIALGNFTGRPDLSTGLHNVAVSGNMIIVDVDGTGAVNTALNPHGTWTGNSITDNHIVVRSQQPHTDLFSIAAGTAVKTIDGNRIYSPQAAFGSTLHGTVYTSLSAWQQATGYDAASVVYPLADGAPSAPRAVTTAVDGSIRLSWTAPAEPGPGVAHYNIYRSTQPSFELTYAQMIGEASGTSFEDRESLEPNTRYYYVVEAEGNNGRFGEASELASATTGDVVPTIDRPTRVSFLAPRDGDYITTAALQTRPYLSGLEEIERVELHVDGRLARQLTSAPYAATLDGLANGEHKLLYRVYDREGRMHESETITIEKQSRALRSVRAAAAPVIDGQSNDWAVDAPGFRLDQREHVREIQSGFIQSWTADKLRVQGATAWDADNLYLFAEVVEDTHHLPITTAADLWKGSSLQLAIDPDRSGKPGAQGYTELAFGLTDGGQALAYRYHAIAGRSAGDFTAGEVAIVRDEASHTTRYELAIPWDELLPGDATIAERAELGISLLANYSDGTVLNPTSSDARNGWIEYNSGIGAGKAPELFGYLLPMNSRFAAPQASGSAAGSSALSLTWAAVDGATGYTVRYGTTSGVYSAAIDARDTHGQTLSGLQPSQRYYVVVEAYNGYGELSVSAELQLSTTSGSTGPIIDYGGTGNTGTPGGTDTEEPGTEGQSETTTRTLPLAEWDQRDAVTLELGAATLRLEPALLRKLLADSSADGASLIVTAKSLDDRAAAVPQQQGHARLRAAAAPLEIKLQLRRGDGTQAPIAAAPGEATLSLTYDANDVNAAWLGVYMLESDSGQWVYVGGLTDAADMTVHASFAGDGYYAILEYQAVFGDLTEQHWAATAITALAARQIVRGDDEGRFLPNGEVTRAEFTALLARALSLPAGDATFTDVATDAWYAEPIAAVTAAGILTGRGDGRFAPQERITRAEMAAIIARALQLETAPDSAGYTDASDIPAWAQSYVAAATASGLMQGRADGSFAPRAYASRAEAAQLIYNLLSYASRD
ncbi:hypothetical protein PA598K_00539 [Paenibacillus sp. 598K]|uniref:S-layer homology domain-containing protein n=1 Tax=Paenibacillus sp. 598K TaxID=1117987 RepID=UPI000FFAE67E|nr:S-layer homology domain-containing protein [Paenibacillus sp. 598K]GBF72299.1 hypothetical protein PA598K_00539 [Paenibacillus sp. 598K]